MEKFPENEVAKSDVGAELEKINQKKLSLVEQRDSVQEKLKQMFDQGDPKNRTTIGEDGMKQMQALPDQSAIIRIVRLDENAQAIEEYCLIDKEEAWKILSDENELIKAGIERIKREYEQLF